MCMAYSVVIAVFSGYGLYATEAFEKDEFLLEYSGELVTRTTVGDFDGNIDYVYFFQLGEKEYWYVLFIYISS